MKGTERVQHRHCFYLCWSCNCNTSSWCCCACCRTSFLCLVCSCVVWCRWSSVSVVRALPLMKKNGKRERREKMNRLSRRLTPNQASYTSRLYLPLTSNNCDTFFNSSTCTARLLRSFNTSFSNVALRPCWCTCRSLLNANSLVCASNTSRSCCNASHLVCHSTVVCW